MTRQHLTRITKLEAALQPPQPDEKLTARLTRACARCGLPEPTGPVYHGGDPCTRLRAAERRLTCAD